MPQALGVDGPAALAGRVCQRTGPYEVEPPRFPFL